MHRTLLLSMLAMAVVPLLLGSVSLLALSQRLIVDRFAADGDALAEAVSARIDDRVDLATHYARLVADLEPTRQALLADDRDRARQLLIPLKARLGLTSLNLADAEGRFIASAQDRRRDGVNPEALARLQARAEQYWVLEDDTRGLMLRATAAVRQDGQLIGVVEADVALDRDFLRPPEGGRPSATGGPAPELALAWRGQVRAATAEVGSPRDVPSVNAVRSAPLWRLTEFVDGAAGRYYGVYRAVESHQAEPALLAIYLPFEPVESAARTSAVLVLLLVVLLAAGAVVAALRVSAALAGPLARLVQAVQRVEAGDLALHVETSSQAEVGTLERAFNTMTRSLRERERALRDRLAESEAVNAIAHVALAGEVDGEPYTAAFEALRTALGASAVAVVWWDEDATSRGGSASLAVRRGIADAVALRLARRVRELIEPDRTCLLPHGRGLSVHAGLIVSGRLLGVLSAHFEGDRESLEETSRQTLLTVARLVGVARANLELVRQLEVRALRDDLTGLLNRVAFHDHLEAALAQARLGQQGCAIVLTDLDRFKDVNDTFGHAVGDRVLREFAERLRRTLRQTDQLARLGGDEFAVLLPGVSEAAVATQVAKKMHAMLETPFQLEDVGLRVETSIGIALAPAHGDDAEALLKAADIAMYQAKRARTGQVVASAGDDGEARERLVFVGDLRQAIDTAQLGLVYQPKVDLATGALVGVEALVRWQHPRRGLVLPAEFIPVAEQTGLIRRLTQVVLDLALEQAARWSAAGAALPIALNVSMQDLHDPGFAAEVAQAVDRWQVPARLLTFEITESSLMADQQRATETLARLATMGAGIAVDDFGTGYSSLDYLKRLRVDELKIDRSFVRDCATSDNDRAIVRAAITLGHDLGLAVVAEGVEDARVAGVLRELGCDLAQGYLFSPPVAASELDRSRGRIAVPDRAGEQAA